MSISPCVVFVDRIGKKDVRLAAILLCLEGARVSGVDSSSKNKKAGVIGGACAREMSAHRKMLMEDFSISPEIVKECKKDISVMSLQALDQELF